MDILFTFVTYNRPNIMRESITTALQNTNVPIQECWIVDDGSQPPIQVELFNFALNHRESLPINLILKQKNEGIGWNFEYCYDLARIKNPDIWCLMESDYLWRKGWLEDCLAVFEANPHTIAILGCDHPDTRDRAKTHGLFPKLMMEQFPKDISGREYMYSPFITETSRGKIIVEGASNSCGCAIYSWKKFQNILNELTTPTRDVVKEFWTWMDRAFNKQVGGNRRHASDQHFSCTPTWYWYEWAEKNNIDLTKNFPWLNIRDTSISSHICGGGENGKIVPEGHTFVGAPSWNPEHLKIDPRENK